MDAARFAEVHVLAMDYTRGYVYIMEQDKLRRIDTSKEKKIVAMWIILLYYH